MSYVVGLAPVNRENVGCFGKSRMFWKKSDVSENSFFLPEELIYNILLRLPVKFVLVCTSVCKAWNFFIKSPSFVSSHLSRTISSYKDSGNLIYLLQLLSWSPTRSTYSFSLRSDDEKLSEHSAIHFPYKHKAGFQVISSCNGLVLLKNGDSFYVLGPSGYHVRLNMILWNPVLRKSVVILKEKKMTQLCAAGLGLDSSGDYKVLTIFTEKCDGDFKVELYSLKTNSWKRLHFEGMPKWFPTFDREMIFVNGAFHLISFLASRPLILGFNLDAETFHEIELPETEFMPPPEIDDRRFSLWGCGEALAVAWKRETGRVFERQLWVMEKHGVPESWTHLSTVSQKVDDSKFMVYRNDINVLLSYFRSRSIPSMMVSLDLKSQETYLNFFGGNSNCYFLGNYVESLVLMDKGDDLSLVYETDAKGISNNASSSWMKKVVNYAFGILCVKSSDEVSSELGQDLGETSSGAAIQNANEYSTDDASLEA